jgi:hypothetical protein
MNKLATRDSRRQVTYWARTWPQAASGQNCAVFLAITRSGKASWQTKRPASSVARRRNHGSAVRSIAVSSSGKQRSWNDHVLERAVASDRVPRHAAARECDRAPVRNHYLLEPFCGFGTLLVWTVVWFHSSPIIIGIFGKVGKVHTR